MRALIPSLPNDEDDDQLSEEDREVIAALKHRLGPEDNWTDEDKHRFVAALLRYRGLELGDDYVLIGDSSATYDYRPMLLEERLAELEYYAELEEALSKALRHDLDVPAADVEAMDGLPELSDAYTDAMAAAQDERDGGEH